LLVDLVCFIIWFIWFIRLVWFNQINKTNQTNQLNETDGTDQMNKTGRLALYDHSHYLPPGSRSNPPQLGIPSSEGIGTYLYTVIPDSLTTRKGLAGCGKTISVRENVDGPHVRHNGRTPHWMLKKADQQGRSK